MINIKHSLYIFNCFIYLNFNNMSSKNTTINITVIENYGNVKDLHMNRTNAPRKAAKKVESSTPHSSYCISYLPGKHK